MSGVRRHGAVAVAAARSLTSNPKRALRALRGLERSSLIILGISWVCAAGLMILAFSAYGRIAEIGRTVEYGVVGMPKIPQLVFLPVPREDVQSAVSRYEGIGRGIRIESQADGTVIVSTAAAHNFQDWLLIMGFLEMTNPEWRWTVKKMCAAAACQGNSLQAHLQPFRKVISVKP
jgi:hypothetical protein